MKKLSKIFEIILHVLGFPLLLLVVTIVSMISLKGGAGYGLPIFVGMILTIVLGGVYYLAYFILTRQEKKRREKLKGKIEECERKGLARPSDPGIRTGIVLAIVAVCTLAGLWGAVDNLLPNAIAGATSNTVYWEDLSDNWEARGEVHEELLETFITRSFYAGNLKSKSLNDYLKEGITNKEVKELINKEFASIDKNGYATYVGPSIDLAQKNRMTIPALVHLLLDNRGPVTDGSGNRLDEKIPLITFVPAVIPSNQPDITLDQNYQYMRHNGEYIFYTEDFEEVGERANNLVIFESNVGYRKIQFLSSKTSEISYTYVIDTANGFEMKYYETSIDRVLQTITVKKDGNGYKVTSYDGEEEVVTSYTTLDLLYEGEEAFELFKGLNITGIADTKVVVATDFGEPEDDDARMPIGWSGYGYIVLEKSTTLAYADWNVLDMLGEPMGFELPLSMIKDLNIEFGPVKLSGEDLLTKYAQTINDVLATAGELTAKKELLGSKLTISLNYDTGELSLVPCNEERGTLDYMKTAWLYNNGLLYVLVSLFATRKLYLIFAAIIALTSYGIGVMHAWSNENEAQTQEEAVIPDDEEVILDDTAVSETDV